jgi:hypothetical protein
MAKRLPILAPIFVMCSVGCAKHPLPLQVTYPVHGKVTYKDGTPLSGGLIQFLPEADSSLVTNATINSDGTYRLTTMRDGLRAPGAVAGKNRVIIVSPPTAHGDEKSLLPIIVPTPYNVERRNNQFDLMIERPLARNR